MTIAQVTGSKLTQGTAALLSVMLTVALIYAELFGSGTSNILYGAWGIVTGVALALPIVPKS